MLVGGVKLWRDITNRGVKCRKCLRNIIAPSASSWARKKYSSEAWRGLNISQARDALANALVAVD